MSFLGSLSGSKTANKKFVLHDFSALTPEGKRMWFLLAVPQIHSKDFLEALHKKGKIDIKRYGKILATGEGEKPPEDLRNEIIKQYCS